MLVKKQKMSASLSCIGVCVAGANSSGFHRVRLKLQVRSAVTDEKLLTDRALVQLSVWPPFRPHIDILEQLLNVFLRVRAWTAGRRAGSHAFWESDVTCKAHIDMYCIDAGLRGRRQRGILRSVFHVSRQKLNTSQR